MRIMNSATSPRTRLRVLFVAAALTSAVVLVVVAAVRIAPGRPSANASPPPAARRPQSLESPDAGTQSACDLSDKKAAAPDPGGPPGQTTRRRPEMWRPGISPGTLVSVTDRWIIESLLADQNRQYFPAVRAVTISEYSISTRSFRLLDELPYLEEVTVRVGGRDRLPWWTAEDEAKLPPRVRVTATHISHLSSRPLSTVLLGGVILDKDGIAELSKCTTLRFLGIGDCDLSGASLDPLAALVHIERLWLGGTALPRSAVDVIVRLPRIEQLDVADTGLTPRDVARLRAALPHAAVTADDSPVDP